MYLGTSVRDQQTFNIKYFKPIYIKPVSYWNKKNTHRSKEQDFHKGTITQFRQVYSKK